MGWKDGPAKERPPSGQEQQMPLRSIFNQLCQSAAARRITGGRWALDVSPHSPACPPPCLLLFAFLVPASLPSCPLAPLPASLRTRTAEQGLSSTVASTGDAGKGPAAELLAFAAAASTVDARDPTTPPASRPCRWFVGQSGPRSLLALLKFNHGG